MTFLDMLKQLSQLPTTTADLPPGNWPSKRTQKTVYSPYKGLDLPKAYQLPTWFLRQTIILDPLVLTLSALLKMFIEILPRLLVLNFYNFKVRFLKVITDQLRTHKLVVPTSVGLYGV